MLDSQNENKIKLIDFGFAADFSKSGLKGACGTLNYVAPELLENKEYDEKCDMWSIGVMLYKFLSN